MTPPSFNTWTIVFLIAAAQGFFMALILWRWQRGQQVANRLLSVLLVLFSVMMLEYVLYWTGYIINFPHAAELSAHFPFLYGPVIWLYLRTIYTGKRLSRYDLWHLLPFVLAVLVFLPWYTLNTAEKQNVFLKGAQFPARGYLFIAVVRLRIAHSFFYTIWNAWYLHRQPAVGATKRWAMLVNGFLFGFGLAYASYFILVCFPFFNNLWDYHISAIMAAFIYAIAYAGYTQPAVFEGFTLAESALVKYKNSGLTPEASRSLLQRLDLLFTTEKLYRDPALNLDTLALRLEASKHHVSQVINAHRQANFFEYLNQLRIEEAKQLLAETNRSTMHVIEIAYAVGFNNKVSFNTAFKKVTGQTPTAYRKNYKQTDGADVQPQDSL